MIYKPVELTAAQIDQFQDRGYLIIEKFLDLELVNRLIERFDPLFATQFETGIYPDEWFGRPGLSQSNATRQMGGMWRCDRTVASFSLSAEIARLNATLAAWSGGRLATDSCWIKPPGAPEVYFHRNNTYVSCIDPSTVITCWIALSDATPEAGTLEFVPGSHKWECPDKVRFLHAPKEDYRQPLWDAATEVGIASPEIVLAEIPPGGCIFLHGNLWHGSGRNTTSDKTRRSFAISTFPAETKFQPPGIGYGYIYSRYRSIGETQMDESFFPILWTQDGYQTPFVKEYREDALVSYQLTVNSYQ
ncbi:phytanoyl-CoA dioxygenase family protein [Scytonema millei]|uniref:Phytanoyl-CoA dioxygenase family protein n=1 Tax=Scytonema millei VB511283 TaxID=1245923 RepID=A0A9X5E4J7_9CYAN|nr:phytanoyl-CoA dioxygenase family protein [Scytonema millei]NHC33882.1 phytanoyl-CoA dioxygenase family protein [Scytonema millei VB511283]